MTEQAFPERWTALPREVRDAVLGRLLARRLEAGSATPAFLRADRSRPVPVSLEQAFILEQQRRFGGRVAWTIAAPPIVLDDLDVEAAQRAVEALARRHDALHTTIRERDGRFFQHVDPGAPVPFKLTRVPLKAAVTGPEAWIRRHFEDMLAEPFDPAAGPPWRAELVYRGARGVILLAVCSLVADGESLALMEAELRSLYAAMRGGSTASLPAPEFGYADYAATQAMLVEAGHFAKALEPWRERLAGGPPVQGYRARGGIGAARLYEQVLGSDTGRALDAFAAAQRTTPHAVLLREFAEVVAGLDGGDEVWIASATATRDRPETHGMVGTFARLVPLRLRGARTGFPLESVQATLVDAMDAEPVPHLLLQEMLEAEHPGAPSAFRYIFNHRLVGDGREGGEAGDLPFQAGPAHAAAHREEDILFMVLQSGERRRLHWYLRSDRFGVEQAERLLVRFHTALRQRLAIPADGSGSED